MGSIKLKAGDLEAVVGDNGEEGAHRKGYNGLWSLKHAACQRGIFVPEYAGLNLEHIFDGATPDQRPEVFFEPRHAPMSVRRTSETSAELHQPPTPQFHLESWTEFRLVPPHAIDFRFRFVPRQHAFQQGWIGLFWASYIHAPEDNSLYFLGGSGGARDQWRQLSTPEHNAMSAVRHRDDTFEPKHREENRPSLFRNYSPLRYDAPFYYGLFENLVWMLMFEKPEGIRFVHSPSGGGFDAPRRALNPAWDFQYTLPKYEVNREYAIRARAVLRPRCSREEILAEAARWGKAGG
jgi:hypothetical protein